MSEPSPIETPARTELPDTSTVDAAPDGADRRARLVVGGGWFVAVLLRVLWTLEWSTMPFWTHHRLDSAWYHEAGIRIAAGDWLQGTGVLHMSPLYGWFVGALYAVFGSGPAVVPAAQLVLGLATVGWIASICRRIGGQRAGWAGLWLAAVFGPLVYYTPLVLATTLATAATAWVIDASLRAAARGTEGRLVDWAQAGVAIGLAVLVRPNALLFVPLVGLAALMTAAPDLRVRVARALVVGLAAALLIAPVTARNRIVAGESVLVTDSGGLNFHIGNGRGANGVFRIPDEVPEAGSAERQFAHFRAFAEEQSGRALTAREVDAFWYGRARADIAADPGRWAALLGRKFALYWGAEDIPNTHSLPFAQTWSVTLGALPGFGWLAGLALVGTALLLVDRRLDRRLLGGFGVVCCAMLVLFFVLGHYRLPAAPALLPAAVSAFGRIVELLRQRRSWGGSLLAIVVATTAWSFVPRLPSTIADEYFKLGYAWQVRGRAPEAEAAYLEAIGREEHAVSARKNLGMLHAGAGRFDEARAQWEAMLASARALGDARRVAEAESLLSKLPRPEGGAP